MYQGGGCGCEVLQTGGASSTYHSDASVTREFLDLTEEIDAMIDEYTRGANASEE
jgi:hypothetical protein